MYSSAARRGPVFYKCEQKRLELLAEQRKQEAIRRAIEAKIILDEVEASIKPKPKPDLRPIVNFHQNVNRKLKIAEIVRIVAHYFDITEMELLSERRTKNVVTARHVLYWLCREVTPYSLPEIGRRLDGRDHTTILHGIRKIDHLISAGDPVVTQCYALRSLWDEPQEAIYWGA